MNIANQDGFNQAVAAALTDLYCAFVGGDEETEISARAHHDERFREANAAIQAYAFPSAEPTAAPED